MSCEAAKPRRHSRQTVKGFLYVIGATILWSIVPVCVKFTLVAMDAYTLSWVRFVVGALILLVYARATGPAPRIPRKDWWLIAVAAAGIGGNYTMYIRGLQDTTASAGHVVVQFEVVSLVFLSHVWLKERISRAKLVGIFVTFVGVFLALWNGEGLSDLMSSKYFHGNMLILIAAPLWAVYGIAQKLLTGREVRVSSSLGYIFALAALMTLPTVILGYDPRGPMTWHAGGWLAVLIVFCTVGAYVMVGKGFALLDASTTAAVTCLLPIFTIVVARIFLHEPTTLAVGAGAVMVVLGILVIERAEASAKC